MPRGPVLVPWATACFPHTTPCRFSVLLLALRSARLSLRSAAVSTSRTPPTLCVSLANQSRM